MVFYDLDEAQAQYIINQLMYWVEMPPASGQYDPATRIFRLDMPAMAEYWHPRQKFIDRANRVAFKSRHPAMREYLAGISEVHVPVLVGEGA